MEGLCRFVKSSADSLTKKETASATELLQSAVKHLCRADVRNYLNAAARHVSILIGCCLAAHCFEGSDSPQRTC